MLHQIVSLCFPRLHEDSTYSLLFPQGFIVEDVRDVCSCVLKAVCAVKITAIGIVIFRTYRESMVCLVSGHCLGDFVVQL